MKVLVCSDASVPVAGCDAVVLAFEASPDVLHRFARGIRVLRLNDILTDHEPLEARAFELAMKATARSPVRRGVPLLDVYRAPIADHLYRFLVIERLHAFLAAEFPTGADFVVRDPELLGGLRLCSPGLRLAPAGPPGPPTPRWRRRVDRAMIMLRDGRRHHGARDLWFMALDQADRGFHVRRALYRNRTDPPCGSTWLISGYESYSRVLQAYARTLEEAPCALTFSESGRRVFGESLPGDRLYADWDFAHPDGDPSPAEVAEAAAIAEESVRTGLADHAGAQRYLTGGTFWNEFRERMLRLLMAQAGLLAVFFDRVSPARVVTANQYSFAESMALWLARERAIPSVQIQHGVLEAFYRYDAVRSDRFFVVGDYWRDMLPASERGKAEVRRFLFAEGYAPAPRDAPRRDRITFFTASLANNTTPFIDPRLEAGLVLGALLEVLGSCPGLSLLVRVHPSEPVGPWVDLWDSLPGARDLRVQGRVLFDKVSSVTDVVGRTRVAVTYFSSVFVECLRQGVPMVSVGWFRRPAYRSDFETMGVWRCADDAASLVAEVRAAVDGDVLVRPERAVSALLQGSD